LFFMASVVYCAAVCGAAVWRDNVGLGEVRRWLDVGVGDAAIGGRLSCTD
jgi:hypothetical protein